MNYKNYVRRASLVAVGVLTALTAANAAVTLDASFDTDGLVFIDFSTSLDSARTVAMDANNKILLAGLAQQGPGSAYVDAAAVLRLNADGSLDTTFGTGGKFTVVGGTPANFGGADARAIAVQSDGRIVVAGLFNQNDGSGNKVMALRLLANGTLDPAFGIGGIVVATQSGRIDSIAIQSDGRIVLAGYASVPSAGNRGLVMRLEANGTLDTTFGTAGVYELADPFSVEFRDVRVLSTGSILVAGTNDDLLLVRLTSAGQLDTTYSGDGIASANLSTEVVSGATLKSADGIEAMAIDTDGSVVVAGGSRPATGNLRAVLARFTPAGALDTGFDTDGWREVPIRTTSDLAYGVAIANDGSIVVAGLGIRVSQFSSDGTTVSQSTSTLGGTQAVTQLVKQADGKIVGGGERPAGGFDYQFAAVRLDVTPLVVVPADTTPDAFVFVDQANVAKAAVIESAPVTITGITAATSVTVTGGEFSVGCTGTYGAAAATITNGQTICARHTSSATGATAVNTAVTIGGVSDTFSSTTLADPDTTPAAFSFTDIEDVERSAVQSSNAITVSGINAVAPISVSGGEYSIGCGATFTSAVGTVSSGQTVCVRHTSADAKKTTVTTTLTIGGVSDGFSSTTKKGSGGGGAADLWLAALALVGLAAGRRRRERGASHV